MRGPHGERSRRPAAHELREERGAVGPRVTEPGDACIGRHERDGVAVGEHRVALDRDGVGAGEPLAAALDEAREQARDVVRLLDAELREGDARADLDAEVGAGQAAEGVLVGHVVADEDRGGGADLMAQGIERVALVGLDDGELDHLLALARVHAGQQRRARTHGVAGGHAVRLGGLPVVQRSAGGLELDRHARPQGGDRVQLVDHAVAQRERLGRQSAREADVELGAVAADEVDLLGQARERGEVVQRAARDDRDARVGQRREGTQRGDRLALRAARPPGTSTIGASVPS